MAKRSSSRVRKRHGLTITPRFKHHASEAVRLGRNPNDSTRKRLSRKQEAFFEMVAKLPVNARDRRRRK